MKKIDKLNKNGIFYLRQGYYKFSACKSKNKVFFGYFESAKYFYNIRNELLEEFTPKEEPLEKNKKIYVKKLFRLYPRWFMRRCYN